jgi:creatinine amidohydrolase
MQLPSRYWADLGTLDFVRLQASADVGSVVAVLPVAATEQHGPHLPLSVDTTIVESVLQAALPLLPAELPVLVLPTQAVGKSNEHARFPGTLSLSSETVLRVWTEIGACVARAGIRKLLLFNAHGGHVSLMDLAARDLRAEHDLIVYACSWYNLPQPPELRAQFDADEERFGIHAGDMETSMLLATRPAFVHMELARNFGSTSRTRAAQYPILGNGRSAKLGWQMQDYNPEGAAGNAAAATAAKGEALVTNAAAHLAQLLAEISRLPLSTLVDGPRWDPAAGGG